MPKHKKLRIAAETMYIYAPLAHRLGLYQIKTEFEDICMRITDNETYMDISNKIEATEEQRQSYINRFIAPIKQKIDQHNIRYRIQGRPKAISSIYNKIKKKNVEFEEIYDLFAVRIILDVPRIMEKPICWQVYSIITDYYKPIPERLKDWITTPKGNGYESLHTTVIGPSGRFVEVQIRTERMNDIAERGFAAHWKYKGIKSEDNVYDKWLNNIRTLLENQNGDAVDFLNDFKTNLFKEEVYVFTPKGDMKILPKGATALDFAFDIHSDVGAQAISFKVNNKLVPMGYVLKNGDQVTINTSKNQSPKEDWLKLVITGKARSKIRSSLNEKKRLAAEIGKESLIRKLRNLKVDFEANADKIVSHFGEKNRQDLYLAIEQEKIKLQDLTKYFEVINNQLELIKKETPERTKEISTEPSSEQLTPGKASKSDIVINGQFNESFDYSLSTCCNPVPGDEIFAFLTSNAGMKIHRFNCSNASNLFTNYGYRILKAEWANTAKSGFVVELKLTGIDTIPEIHIIVEAMRRAYQDRAIYLGDPDFTEIPIEKLLDKEYILEKFSNFDMTMATKSESLSRVLNSQGEDTTHFSVIDSEGNYVAATLSINYPFGSGFVVPGTGILLNDEMDDFSMGEDVANIWGLVGSRANAIEPGKRMLSSMTPLFARDSERTLIVGTPGGSRIISMLAIALLKYQQDANANEIVSQRRFHHQYLPDQIQFEQGVFSQGEQQRLTEKGHVLKELNRSYGNMHAIIWDKRLNTIDAAADPRGEGLAIVH